MLPGGSNGVENNTKRVEKNAIWVGGRRFNNARNQAKKNLSQHIQ